VSHRGDQAAGVVVHRLPVQRTQAGRLG
jgi:hypothetical protein